MKQVSTIERISKPDYYSKTIRITVAVCAYLLAGLFLYASYNKLIIYNTFVSQLKGSPITKGFEQILAWLVPSLEITIAVFLLFKRSRLPGLWASFFLMLLFTAYVYIIPHYFPQQTCSCGGIISTFSWKEHFWFNLIFTIIAGTGLSLISSKKSY